MKNYINEVKVGDICEQHYNMAALTGLGWGHNEDDNKNRERQICSFSFDILFGNPHKNAEKKKACFEKMKTKEGFDFMLQWAKSSENRYSKPNNIFTSRMILASAENNSVFSVATIERKFYETLIIKSITFSEEERKARIGRFVALQEARDIYKYKDTLKEYIETQPEEKTNWDNTNNFMSFVIFFNNRFINKLSNSLDSFKNHNLNIVETETSKLLLGSKSIIRFDTSLPFIEESLKKVLTRLEIDHFKEQLKDTVYTPISKSDFILLTPPGAESLHELLIKRKESLLAAANEITISSSETIIYHKSNEETILNLVKDLREHPNLESYSDMKAEQKKEFDFMEKEFKKCKNIYSLKGPSMGERMRSAGAYIVRP